MSKWKDLKVNSSIVHWKTKVRKKRRNTMKILHGTWIPQTKNDFKNGGRFFLWVETDSLLKGRRKTKQHRHPRQLLSDELQTFFDQQLGFGKNNTNNKPSTETKYFILPSTPDSPLPSIELARYLEEDVSEALEWKLWEIDCYPLTTVIKSLNDLHFLCQYQSNEIQLGADLLFWYHYSQHLKQIIIKDQYIPSLKYRENRISKGKKKKKDFEIYPSFEFISQTYEQLIKQSTDYMPLACVSGINERDETLKFYEKETLLRHFSENLLNEIVNNTPITATFAKKFKDVKLLEDCLNVSSNNKPWIETEGLEHYHKWQQWRHKLTQAEQNTSFNLCFQLIEAEESQPDYWQVKFVTTLKTDPSFKVELEDYWQSSRPQQKKIQQQFGQGFEREVLLNLGYAARIYPPIWQGLETDQPLGFSLTNNEAFDFLKEQAWVLEDAGYKVIVPSWWTPSGRQRAKLRLRATAREKKSAASSSGKGYFQLDTIIQYKYELSIGDQPLSPKEWEQLVLAKTPLIKFRGQWMELNPEKMQQMLEFWQKNQQSDTQLTIFELLHKSSEMTEEFEVELDEDLNVMMKQLTSPSSLTVIDNPRQFQGTLREYQKRGVSWIQYLEQLGLNGCLADDMGLGKTVQVIARLVTERERETKVNPTLLIAPTSVVGNWQKEIEKFAPQLKVMVHHGSVRVKKLDKFEQESLKQDVVITSFTLARKDAKLFQSLTWHRIVLDEAQNIKNPKAAQTKAILKLQSHFRLALTGTPVENRLLDLWSIFNFLNPGYLGKETHFRKVFELPIQKENNQNQSVILKKLVQPFILRRLKTDQQIIKDLPDKVEHKQYCNLTKEQASLYEAVVKDVLEKLEDTEGIQRKGLILSTLLRLKQICNHPRQFLQDNSDFIPNRSHKLERLGEMLEEVIAEGDSFLIFTQFTEIGEALKTYLKQTLYYNTYYIHGGTNRQKRQQMITQFQDQDTPPSAFILSLKAGGVGITLTKANHVFHFDRWWNPAVEEQATDRAFRIGQKKNVFVHKFVTLGTIEERIDVMIEDKKKMASAIVGSDESWLTELDNETFKELISLNKQTVL